MSNGYTPTKHVVKLRYIDGVVARYPDVTRADAGAEFDRWFDGVGSALTETEPQGVSVGDRFRWKPDTTFGTPNESFKVTSRIEDGSSFAGQFRLWSEVAERNDGQFDGIASEEEILTQAERL